MPYTILAYNLAIIGPTFIGNHMVIKFPELSNPKD